MTDTIENRLLEQLQRCQEDQGRIEHKLDEIVNRLGSLEQVLSGLRRDFLRAEELRQQSTGSWII